jgi:predicted Fe-Mo cluster-binding NifX family protein
MAAPLFKDRVSPHFGTSSLFLIVEVGEDGTVSEARGELTTATPLEAAAWLVDLGVNTIICGGISTVCKQWLESNGVVVLDNRRGPARQVIEDYRRGRFTPPAAEH